MIKTPAENTQVSTLPNGIRVATTTFNDRESVAVGLWVHVGGRDEAPQLSGVSHFLEHLVFKGTAKRTANQIKESVEGVGGTLNAFTSEECTCFLAKSSHRHLAQVFDVLSDMVLNASLKKEDIRKERTVVMEEIKMTHDQPAELAEELFTELLWPGHALGMPIAGTFKTVGELTQKNIRDHRDYFYKPEFITIIASGAIQHPAFLNLARVRFGSQKKTHHSKDINLFRRTHGRPELKFFSKPTKQTQLVFGMHACPKDHPDEYALDILSVLLGGNMSSRLFNEVREERGLAYDIGTSTRKFHETGAFTVSAGVDPNKAETALGVILKELEKVTRHLVGSDELKRAKEFYLGQLDLALENTLNHMLWIGEGLLSRARLKNRRAVIRRVTRIGREDIRRVAKNTFKTEAPCLAVVGPKPGRSEKKFRKLLDLSTH